MHSQFKRYGTWNFWKFKIFFKLLNFQESFTTCKWGVMCMTYKTNLYFIIQEKKPKVVNVFLHDSKLC
jgi:hypothetical protein